MSGIYLNNINMDIFLKYFTKDKLDGSSQELVNYDEEVLIRTFTINGKYIFNTVDLSMSAPTDKKEYGCYDAADITSTTSTEEYCKPYISLSSMYGDYHTFITKSKYTYVKKDRKVYPYADLDEENKKIYLTATSNDATDIFINRQELLTKYTSKYYIDGVNTYEIYTSSGLDGYLIENQRLYKNLCNKTGMLYRTKNDELVFLSTGKNDTKFKRFIKALRTDDVNSTEYQNKLLFSTDSPYEIINQKNLYGSVGDILNNEISSSVYKYYTQSQVTYKYELADRKDIPEDESISIVTTINAPVKLVDGKYENDFSKSWTIEGDIIKKAYTIANSDEEYEKMIGQVITLEDAPYTKTYYADYIFKGKALEIKDKVFKVTESKNVFTDKSTIIIEKPLKIIYNNKFSYRGNLLPEHYNEAYNEFSTDYKLLLSSSTGDLDIGSLYADNSVLKMKTHIDGLYDIFVKENVTTYAPVDDNLFINPTSVQTYIYNDGNNTSNVEFKTLDDIELTDAEIDAINDAIESKNPYVNIINYDKYSTIDEEIEDTKRKLKESKLNIDYTTETYETSITPKRTIDIYKTPVVKTDFKDKVEKFLLEYLYNWSDNTISDSEDKYIEAYKKFYMNKIDEAENESDLYKDDTKASEIIYTNRDNIKESIDLLIKKTKNTTWRIG